MQESAENCNDLLVAACKSWFVDEPKIYTEDRIPIRALHIGNLPRYANKSNLYEIFGVFGKITACFVKFKYATVPHYAFVTFSDPEDAKRAQLNTIKMGRNKLLISPADSWHQPRTPYVVYSPQDRAQHGKSHSKSRACSKNSDSKILNNETEKEDEQNILNILNNDCIMSIMDYLNLKDLVRSEAVSKKWASFVKSNLKSRRTFKTSAYHNDLFTTNMLRSVLMKIGPYLKVLHIDSKWSVLNERTPQLIGKYCHNLTELLVTGITASNWRNIMSNCKQLESLTLLSCGNVTDDNFRSLRSNLRELIIACNYKLTGLFLNYLAKCKLKKLVLTNCKNLVIKPVVDGFQDLKHLTYLGVNHCQISIFRDINTIIKLVPNLTEFSCKDILYPGILSMDTVADLKDLTYLNLSRNKMVSDSLLEDIVKGCPKLTYLNISNCGSYLQLFSPPLAMVSNEGFNHIWKLKELSVLIVSSTGIGEKALKLLGVNEGGAKLTKFVCRHNFDITNQAIIKLAENCPLITVIDIYGCTFIDGSVIWGIDKVLVEQPERSSLLEISVAPTKHYRMEEWQNVAEKISSKYLSLRVHNDYGDPLTDRSDMELLQEYYDFEGDDDDQFNSDYDEVSVDDDGIEFGNFLEEFEFVGGGAFYI